MDSFGEVIRKRRKSKNQKVYELAKEIGIHPAYLTQLEKNRRVPSPEVLRKIEKALAIDLKQAYMKLTLPADFLEPFKNIIKEKEAQPTKLASINDFLATLLRKKSQVDAKAFLTSYLKILSPKKPLKEIDAEAEVLASSAQKFKTIASKLF